MPAKRRVTLSLTRPTSEASPSKPRRLFHAHPTYTYRAERNLALRPMLIDTDVVIRNLRGNVRAADLGEELIAEATLAESAFLCNSGVQLLIYTDFMIPRAITPELLALLKEYPIVTVLGPRQAGKTTLVREVLPDYDYVTLEDPENRQIATEDPKAFLSHYPGNTIFDEVQRTPHLLSYLQGIVDEQGQNGRFVLTGSHQMELRAAIVQSLAGRTAILHLLPLTIAELANAEIMFDQFEQYIFSGFMPRIHHEKQRPGTAYANYYQTYVERDVRQLIRLKDVTLFEKFMKLLAGRVGQLINYQSLANDIGVSGKVVKDWLSVLEASFIVFKVPPYFENFGKRVIKSPKYYFTDVGLLCYLLDIEKPEQVTRDPLVGSLFENLVILELLKTRYNQGHSAGLYFFRDSHGNEIDVLCKTGSGLTGVEIKSAATWNASFSRGLKHFAQSNASLQNSAVVYNGRSIEFSDGIQAVSYKHAATLIS